MPLLPTIILPPTERVALRSAYRHLRSQVLAEAERLVANGVRELNLIAEDTNQYGSDWGAADGRRLHDLIKAIAAMPEVGGRTQPRAGIWGLLPCSRL